MVSPSKLMKVNHSYHDFSCYLEEGGQVGKPKKAGRNFPAKLHQMISDPLFSHIITWMPHGRAFGIISKELLITEAVPCFFGQTKFESFTRQLSGWGFKRLHRPGSDYGCYYHECFLRGLPRLTWLMTRALTNQGKPLPYPEGEPDFYKISRMHPVPSQAAETDDLEKCLSPRTSNAALALCDSVPPLRSYDWNSSTQSTEGSEAPIHHVLDVPEDCTASLTAVMMMPANTTSSKSAQVKYHHYFNQKIKSVHADASDSKVQVARVASCALVMSPAAVRGQSSMPTNAQQLTPPWLCDKEAEEDDGSFEEDMNAFLDNFEL